MCVMQTCSMENSLDKFSVYTSSILYIVIPFFYLIRPVQLLVSGSLELGRKPDIRLIYDAGYPVSGRYRSWLGGVLFLKILGI